jgi:hypothetical protein
MIGWITVDFGWNRATNLGFHTVVFFVDQGNCSKAITAKNVLVHLSEHRGNTMSDKMMKRYRRAIAREVRHKQTQIIESTMSGLFALSRPKRIAVGLQLMFGRKKWTKGN